jgi:hypothetical protein
MTFNFFVLPFFLGLIFLFSYVIKQYSLWIRSLDKADRIRFISGIRSPKIFSALKEIFFESLLHRKMFRKNLLLGYMHMSFAFGWLLLIVMGNMESRIYSGLWVNPPYYPIFLKFFIHDKRVLPFEIFTVPGFFRFSMDLILVFILFGLILALVKRKRSKWFGLKKTTHLQLTDKVAMTCLWLIFPLRLAAESFTAGAYGYGGGFVTQHLGNVLAMLWPFSDKFIAYAAWWLYSLSLGVFFCNPALFKVYAYPDGTHPDLFPQLRDKTQEGECCICRGGSLLLSPLRALPRCLPAGDGSRCQGYPVGLFH